MFSVKNSPKVSVIDKLLWFYVFLFFFFSWLHMINLRMHWRICKTKVSLSSWVKAQSEYVKVVFIAAVDQFCNVLHICLIPLLFSIRIVFFLDISLSYVMQVKFIFWKKISHFLLNTKTWWKTIQICFIQKLRSRSVSKKRWMRQSDGNEENKRIEIS